MTSRASSLSFAAVAVALGCTPPRVSDPAVPRRPAASAPLPAAPRPTQTPAESEVADALEFVAYAHALSVRSPVTSKEVSREGGIRLIIAKTEEDVPREAMIAQGDMFALLELTPPTYAFVDGLFEQVKQNIAGFYDPDDDTMYLLDDLDGDVRQTTLAHELVHALQDQHFRLGERMNYKRGELDKLAALGCFAEGDATSAMFDATGAPSGALSGALSADNLRRAMMASIAFSPSGYATPLAMQASLVSPYVDGFRFVQALRDRGGWPAVNRAWAEPPTSTEQILHLDKYDAREAPLDVATPTSKALGSGFELVDDDVAGELGLRIAMETWASRPQAAKAAAGWGGDRYAVFGRTDADGRSAAFAWTLVFDDELQADEAVALVQTRFAPCRERADLGPFAWARDGRKLSIVAGPLLRRNDGQVSASPEANCPRSRQWLAELQESP